MKRVALWAFALAATLLAGCQNEESNRGINVDYTIEDLAGKWIWVEQDKEWKPSNKMAVSIISTQGKERYFYLENGQWKIKEVSLWVKDNICTFGDMQAEIIHIDKLCMTFESLSDGSVHTAQRIYSNSLDETKGTWYTDTVWVAGQIYLDSYVTFKDDSTFIQGKETGKYGVINDRYCWWTNGNKGGINYFYVEMGEYGPERTVVYTDSIGTKHSITSRKVQDVDYSIEDFNGTWITTVKNREKITLENAFFCEAENGKSVLSGIVDGRWVSNNVTLSLKDNVLKRTLDGQEDEYFTILYFDGNTIIWKSHQDGSVVTRNRIRLPEQFAEAIQGCWYNEEAVLKTGDTVNLCWMVGEDSVFSVVNNQKVYSAPYKLFGDIFVSHDDTSVFIMPFSFGYDVVREERYINHYFLDDEGKPIATTLYGLDIEKKLAGGWILLEKNGEPLHSTYDLEVCYWNPLSHTCRSLFFDNGYNEEIATYTISKNLIQYDGFTDYPWERILTINDTSLLVSAFNGDKYRAKRIPVPNPLNSKIIGKWRCENWTGSKIENAVMNYEISDNGSFITTNETTSEVIYRTFKLYDRLLLLHNQDNSVRTWIVKDGVIGDTMTLIRITQDGTVHENTFTRVVK